MLLSFSNVIIFGSRIYSLDSALPFKLIHDGDYVMIENDVLKIVGAGETEVDAKEDFAREFDFIYRRYNELSDRQMTTRNMEIKMMLNTIVTGVTEV